MLFNLLNSEYLVSPLFSNKSSTFILLSLDASAATINAPDNFDVPKGKENALFILENELSKKSDHGVVGIGSMSDTYNPFEVEYEQTRGALKLLSKYNNEILITDGKEQDKAHVKELEDLGVKVVITENQLDLIDESYENSNISCQWHCILSFRYNIFNKSIKKD